MTPITRFMKTIFKEFGDLQFTQMVTPRLLPSLYVMGIAFSALLALYLVVDTWSAHSWPSRVLWTCVFAPALFIACVIGWRIILELCYAFFQLLLHVQMLSEDVQKVSGITDEIATDLPRIQFWRGRKREPENE